MAIPEVIFYEKTHTYTHTPTDSKPISVTTLIKNYVPPFDREFWLTYKMAQKLLSPEIFHGLKDLYLFCNKSQLYREFVKRIPKSTLQAHMDLLDDDWEITKDEGLGRGTRAHNIKEFNAYEKGFLKNHLDGKTYPTYYKPKLNYDNYFYEGLQYGIHPERLLHYRGIIAGTGDKIFCKRQDRFAIGDYKTNKKLKSKSFDDERLLYPLNKLQNSDIGVYTVQLNLYARMMVEMGGVADGLYLLHIPTPKYKRKIEIPYLPDLIDLLIEDYVDKIEKKERKKPNHKKSQIQQAGNLWD